MHRALIGLFFLAACVPTTPVGDPQPTPRTDADCREIADGRVICFPEGHVCTDPHGIGDGVPIEVDCWTSGGQLCHPQNDGWPECAGGWEAED